MGVCALEDLLKTSLVVEGGRDQLKNLHLHGRDYIPPLLLPIIESNLCRKKNFSSEREWAPLAVCASRLMSAVRGAKGKMIE